MKTCKTIWGGLMEGSKHSAGHEMDPDTAGSQREGERCLTRAWRWDVLGYSCTINGLNAAEVKGKCLNITADIPPNVSMHRAAAFKTQIKHYRIYKGWDRKYHYINLSSHQDWGPFQKDTLQPSKLWSSVRG